MLSNNIPLAIFIFLLIIFLLDFDIVGRNLIIFFIPRRKSVKTAKTIRAFSMFFFFFRLRSHITYLFSVCNILRTTFNSKQFFRLY